MNRVSGNLGGIWLCGSAAHPGGGVMGAIGKQVAERIMKEKIIWLSLLILISFFKIDFTLFYFCNLNEFYEYFMGKIKSHL